MTGDAGWQHYHSEAVIANEITMAVFLVTMFLLPCRRASMAPAWSTYERTIPPKIVP